MNRKKILFKERWQPRTYWREDLLGDLQLLVTADCRQLAVKSCSDIVDRRSLLASLPLVGDNDDDEWLSRVATEDCSAIAQYTIDSSRLTLFRSSKADPILLFRRIHRVPRVGR